MKPLLEAVNRGAETSFPESPNFLTSAKTEVRKLNNLTFLENSWIFHEGQFQFTCPIIYGVFRVPKGTK